MAVYITTETYAYSKNIILSFIFSFSTDRFLMIHTACMCITLLSHHRVLLPHERSGSPRKCQTRKLGHVTTVMVPLFVFLLLRIHGGDNTG